MNQKIKLMTCRYNTVPKLCVLGALALGLSLLSARAQTPGPVAELIFATQPGNGTNSVVLGQQPVLETADASGNPSTVNLGPNAICDGETDWRGRPAFRHDDL